MTLSATIEAGLNNPDCAFFVGSFFGTAYIVKLMLYIACIYWVIKAVDKLALEPVIDYIKRKFKRWRK